MGNGSELQEMLQSAVQAVQWTYSLFWRFCPHQGMLIWEDGYYNGAIKTRKTVQPMEVTAEEASLQRSQQLRELYNSLSAGESNQPPTRRPCASLSPEDLTESEWFYLMCVSFSFPHGVGLPGKAYAKCQHLWLTGANEVDSSVFSRAILAKSAHIQTIVCIPVMDGIVELGFTQKVEEDPSFIKQVKGFFNNHSQPPLPPPKPALSEHSTSNPAPHFASVYTSPLPPVTTGVEVDDDSEAEDEDDSEAETDIMDHLNPDPTPTIGLPQPKLVEHSELMQIEMSEDIRVGSPEDASNNIDSDNFEAIVCGLGPSHQTMHRVDSLESTRRWPIIQQQQLLFNPNDLQQPASGLTPIEDELSQEDTHYSQTVSIILHFQSSNPTSSTTSSSSLSYPPNTAFTKWSPTLDHFPPEGTSQWLLKYVLFTVPYMHTKFNTTASLKSSLLGRDPPRGLRQNKGTPQDELSANHVLAERRRREKLNERFITLRTLVPFVTKMDKASILGDTIEYVKQLRKKIQELEAHEHVRKIRVVDGGETPATRVAETPPLPPPATMTEMLQVSIIESDVLVELQCPYKESLLLDVMLTLKDMRIEVKAIQSSLNNGWFVAELRGKVKENANGKKVSIVEVKKAINQVVPHQHGDA